MSDSDRARAARDIDIDWQSAEEELFDTLIEDAAFMTEDHFTFQVERTGSPPKPRRKPSPDPEPVAVSSRMPA
jgi:hypothetical protein